MDTRVQIAQITNALPGGNPTAPNLVKLTKPDANQAVTIHLDGTVQVDLSSIANTPVTFVHADDRLIILFDNNATVTLEPFFKDDGSPLSNITVELAPDRSVTGAEFASLFPITQDQSVLPTAGNGTPTSGADFETVTIQQLLNTTTPLGLLNPDSPNGNAPGPNGNDNVAINSVQGPTLTVHGAAGNEDKAIALSISEALSIADPRTALGNITITGIPAGVTFNQGTLSADGRTLTLTPAQLAGLTLTSDGEAQHFNLTVTATTVESGNAATAASTTATLHVDVTPVADAPLLTVANASGNEDHGIALNIQPALGEADADAVQTITITGFPAGVTFNHGTLSPDGKTLTLTPAQLAGLTLTSDGEVQHINLTVTATTIDGGDAATAASVSKTLHVDVTPVADAPTLTVANASGNEDHAIALNIQPALAEADADAVIASVTIAGLPSGVTLSNANGDTLTISQSGSITLTPAQLAGLTLTSDGETQHFDLAVTATTIDGGDTATSAFTTKTLHVDVTPVADAPLLSVGQGLQHPPAALEPVIHNGALLAAADGFASGNEDTPIALSIKAALGEVDPDAVLTVTIGGVPSGASLNHGTVIAADANGFTTWSVNSTDVSTLALTSDGETQHFDLQVTATTVDGGDTATAASTMKTLHVDVTPVADAPILTAASAAPTVNEDGTVALNIAATPAEKDPDAVTTVTISGLGTATLDNTAHNVPAISDGSVTLQQSQLAGLTLHAADDDTASLTLTVTATTSDAGSIATTTQTINLTVNPVAETPTLSASAVAPSVNEDGTVGLNITATPAETDPDAVTTVIISGLGTATLSAGHVNADGSVTLQQSDLTNLTLRAADDDTASLTLTVTASTNDNGSIANSAPQTINLTVNPVAEAPTLTVGGLGSASLVLNLPGETAEAPAINDAGTIVGSFEGGPGGFGFVLPPGATTPTILNFGNATQASGINSSGEIVGALIPSGGGPFHGFVLSPDGTRTPINEPDPNTVDTQAIGINDSGEIVGEAFINGKGFVGFIDQGGNFSIINIEGRGSTIVTGVDNAGDVVGTFATDLFHTHGFILAPGATTPTIFDVPGATNSEITGINNSGDFVGVFSGGANAGLNGFVEDHGTITTFDLPGAGQPGSGTTMPTGINDAGQIVGTFNDGLQQSVFETTIAGIGFEDRPIALGIQAALSEADADAVLTVTIGGVPSGASLNHGTIIATDANGFTTWSVNSTDVSTLALTSDGETQHFDLTVTATTVDGGEAATAASTTKTLHVDVTPVPDQPVLTLPAPTSPVEFNFTTVDQGNSTFTELFGVNNNNESVGVSRDSSNIFHGVIDQGGKFSSFDPSGSILTEITAVNDSGTFAGVFEDSSNNFHGFVLKAGATTPTTIDVPGATATFAFGLNNSGEVVGRFTDTSGNIHGFLRDTSGTITTIDDPVGTLPGGNGGTRADGINDQGQIVGVFTDVHNQQHGFVDTNGTFQTIDVSLPGVTLTNARGINDKGQIVGIFDDAKGEHGFLLDPNGTLTVIDAPGSTHTDVFGINASGQVAGTFIDSSGLQHGFTETVVTGSRVAGNEDTKITLGIQASFGEVDPDSLQTVTISGLPTSGVTLSNTNGDTLAISPTGSITLTPAQLAGLALTSDGETQHFDLTVTAKAIDGGATATAAIVTQTLHVDVTAVPDAPVLTLPGPVSGTEDIPIALAIQAALPPDGTEKDASITQITISGIPVGVTLSDTAGPLTISGGSVTLTSAAQLAGLSLTGNGEARPFDLTVTATATDGGNTASTSGTVHVSVAPAPTTPTFEAPGANITAVEDSQTSLGGLLTSSQLIFATEVDPDVKNSVTISGLPTGVTLSDNTGTLTANPDGSVTVQQADFANLKLNVPETDVTSFKLTFVATANDGGVTASSAPDTVTVNVNPLADAPTVSPSFATLSTFASATFDVPPGLHISTEIHGINKFGVIVGQFSNTTTHGFVDNGGVFTTIDVPGATATQVLGINDVGTLVGAFTTNPNGNENQAFIDNNGTFTTFSIAGATLTIATGINHSGEVVGFFQNSGGLHGFERDPSGTITTINVNIPQATNTEILGINDAGQIVGSFISGRDGGVHGFVDTNGVFTQIDAPTNDGHTEVDSINDAGVMSGIFLERGLNGQVGPVGFIDQGGVVTPVTLPAINGPLGVSDDGQAFTIFSDPTTFQTRGLILTPGVSGNEDAPIPVTISTESDPDAAVTVTISNIPTGVTFNDAAHDVLTVVNGSLTLTGPELAGLTLSGDGETQHFDLTLTSSVTDGTNPATQSTVSSLNKLHVDINPVPDAPVLAAADVTAVAPSVNEGGMIGLNITPHFESDADANNTVTISAVTTTAISNIGGTTTSTGLPAGATLTDANGDVFSGAGPFTLTPAQLASLTLHTAVDDTLSVQFTVQAHASEGGTTVDSAIQTLTIPVNPVPDAPHFTVNPTFVGGVTSLNEGGTVGLTLGLAISAESDTDVVRTVTISGLPADATLTDRLGGIHAGGSDITLSTAQIPTKGGAVTITVGDDDLSNITLHITANDSEGGLTASSTPTTVSLHINPVPDAPTLNASDATAVSASVNEDGGTVALTITPHFESDPDASNTVTISGLPTGATLTNANGDTFSGGATPVSLTVTQLAGLTLHAPDGDVSNITLQVQAHASEGGTTADSAVQTISLAVNPVPDTPTVDASFDQASVDESGGTATLTINPVFEDDADAVQTVVITGLPSGATLFDAEGNAHTGDSITLSVDQFTASKGGGAVTVTTGDDDTTSITLQIVAQATEGGQTANSAPTTVTLGVNPVPDAPVLNAGDATAASASVNEDSTVALTITPHFESDPDASNTVTISGLPTGATLTNANGDTFSGGATPVSLTETQLAGLMLHAPDSDVSTITLSVQAHASEGGTTAASETQTITLAVNPVPDAPILAAADVTAVAPSVNEGGTIGLNITPHFESDADATNTITISAITTTATSSTGVTTTSTGLPTGATLIDGNGDVFSGAGPFTLTPAQLAGLTLQTADDDTLSVQFTVQAHTSEGGTTADSAAQTLTIPVNPVPEAPHFTVNPSFAASASSVNEGGTVGLNLGAALPAEGDADLVRTFTISGLPADAILTDKNGGIHAGGSDITLATNQIPSKGSGGALTITVGDDDLSTITLQITANDSEGGLTAKSAPQTLALHINPVPDAPTLNASDATAVSASVNEDGGTVALTITPHFESDPDASNTVTISGLPTGATLTNANGDTFSGGATPVSLMVTQLAGLTLHAPDGDASTITLSVQAHASEGGTTADSAVQTISLAVNPVPDTPTVTASFDHTSVNESGGSGGTATLTINPVFEDDADAVQTVVITGLPSGATLFDAEGNPHTGGGSITLTEDQFTVGRGASPITVATGEDDVTSITLQIVAQATEGGQTADSAPTTVTLGVNPVPDAPVLNAGDATATSASVNEDSTVALTITPHFEGDPDASNTVTISGLPADATLTNANGDTFSGGATPVSLTVTQLAGLMLHAPDSDVSTITLSVQAHASEGGTTADSATQTITLAVNPVPDSPTLAATDVSAASSSVNEDSTVALTITPHFEGDPDASNTITISGLPTGATLTNANGDTFSGGATPVSLTETQLAGLTLHPADNDTSSITLQVQAHASEGGATADSAIQTLSFTVNQTVDIALSSTDVPASAPGAVIGQVTVSDPDDTTFSFNVSDPNFAVVSGTNPGTFELKLQDGVTVDHLSASPITITANDADGAPISHAFTLTLPVELFAADHETLLGSFSTVQAAVDAAKAPGEFIDIKSGTYAEQVVVDPTLGHGTDGLTISALAGASVTLDAPSSLVSTGNSPASGRDIDGLITVSHATGVTIEGIDVNGLHDGANVTGSTDPTLVGVAFIDASGTVDHVDVTGVRDPDSSFGDQRGVGIEAVSDSSGNSFVVTNSSVEDFQKGGIVTDNVQVDIEHNTITGAGATDLIAQNGIQVSDGSGEISNNTISQIGYIPQTDQATGILFFDDQNLTVDNNVITGALHNGQPVSVLGIAGLNSANIEIQGNQITNVAEAILGQEDSSFSSGAFLPPWAIGATNIVVNATQQALDFEVDPANPHAFNITGTTGNDLIIGGAGNDIINGSGGADVLTGGGGANTFVFDNNALSSAKQATPGIAEVTDFNASPQNQVDLSALLDAAFSSGQQANNLVQVTEDPSHNFSTLSVNVGGTATPNQFVAIAHLDNVHTGAVVTAVLDHAQHTAQVHVG